ncbi:MAG TPA: LacI family DNA-binding transcriptional regulator [Chthoniobacteraceae bacterium]|nr:LacI family DNA-binding transcriptional regulator [Chthoniobacteraceae bacterium]
MARRRSLPSLMEISKEIGVSAATISRVMNGRPGISQKTRKVVLGALEARGFPSKMLAQGASPLPAENATVAYAISSELSARLEAGDAFYGRHLFAVQSACSAAGIYPLLFNYEEDLTPEGNLACVAEGRVFGVIAEWVEPEVVEKLRHHVPMVLFNSLREQEGIDCVIPDVPYVAREQMRMLYDLGHRSIACFRNLPSGWQSNAYWGEFWLQTVKMGLPFSPEYFEPIRFSEHGEKKAIDEFLDRVLKAKYPPTAIVTADFYAGYLMEQCAARGFPVPEKMSVIGFDDRGLDAPVPLTSYRQDFRVMAREALRALLDRRLHPDLPTRVIEVRGKMIPRASVAPPRQ